ncbi:MAG: Ig-like domain-containing protein [Lachnospiraceae bacterium]|nr:Ig-like domain-containing protein [Lachnospiraceae bacterium]
MQKRQESTKNVKKRTVGGALPKKGNGGAAKSKKSNPAGKREDFLDFQPKKQTPSKAQVHNKKKKEYQNGGSKKSAPVRPAREFAAMDAVVAFTGLLVLVVAVLTTGIYLSSAEVAKQKEAIAAVGKKLEQVGTAGEEILSAVARQREEAEDARDVSEAAPMEYEEKELETDMDLALKMTSVEKDLKIKFTNRETGKLVGNQAFTVLISGPVSKTASDDDKDGILYLADMTPGDYTVTVTGPDTVDGGRAAGVSGNVTVKDKIVYEQIDVADEVKKESEINASKEDTAVHEQAPAAPADTVEWVESTRTEIAENGGDAYEEVKKSDIPAPSAQAAAYGNALFGERTEDAVWFSKEGVSGNDGDGQDAKKVEELQIPSSSMLKSGSTTTLSVTAKPEDAADISVDWKVEEGSDIVSVDEKGVITALKPGNAMVKAVARDGSGIESNLCVVMVVENENGGQETEGDSESSEQPDESQSASGSAPLKDRNGARLYCKEGDSYREATAADYEGHDVFYRKKESVSYRYTGWQTIGGKRYFYDKNGNPVTGDQIIQGVKYSFREDGSLDGGNVMGIDISKHNGTVDWNAVKNAGVEFVILRCGYRGSASGVLVEDEKFRTNIKGATAAGLKVGIYFFSQAVNEMEAVEEASLTLSLIKGHKISYPVYIDVEAANGRADGLSAAERTKVVKAFCETVRDSGYTAGVYSNKNWFAEKMDTGAFGNYRIWLAQYTESPTYTGRYEMWQYSSRGTIPGIKGDVDLNIFYQ